MQRQQSTSNYVEDKPGPRERARTKACLFSVKHEVGSLKKVLSKFEVRILQGKPPFKSLLIRAP